MRERPIELSIGFPTKLALQRAISHLIDQPVGTRTQLDWVGRSHDQGGNNGSNHKLHGFALIKTSNFDLSRLCGKMSSGGIRSHV